MLLVVGFFWAMVNVNSLPLVYDYGDERKIGAYTGLYYFSSQLAAVLGPTLGGVAVTLLGNQYRWLFIFSTFFMALAWLAMTGVKDRIVACSRKNRNKITLAMQRVETVYCKGVRGKF